MLRTDIDPPGGFVYGSVLPQAAKYKNPKGAIVHARGGSMPYFSYMCLVTGVRDGKVLFDEGIGCDQGGPTPKTPGKAWDWCALAWAPLALARRHACTHAHNSIKMLRFDMSTYE